MSMVQPVRYAPDAEDIRLDDEAMRSRVWAGVEAHRPPDPIERARHSADFRRPANGCPDREPAGAEA